MPFDVSRILQDAAPAPKDMTLPETGPRTAETIGSEIRYLSHQAKCMTVWFGVEIGKRLAEAKAMVGHGGWLDFLKNETEFSKSSAARFMQIAKEYGNNSNFPMLGNLSVSNALQLLAVPAEEREEFAEAVDAENLSTRELEQAIRERDEARRQLEAERAASEGTALKLADVTFALDAEKEKTAALRERTDAQAAKITELENRPVEVAVQAADPAEIEKAVADALAEAEKKHKADVAALEKRRREAEKKQAELQAEAAKAMADLKNSTGRADELKHRVETLQSELEAAKANAEKKAKAAVEKLEQEKADLERQLDSSTTKLDAAVRQAKAAGADTDVAACRVYFTELQQTAAKVQELIGKINAKDPATGAKLSAAVISVLQSTAKNLEVAQ